MLTEEILLEIDTTLDQLITNANAIKHIDYTQLSEEEIDGFYKTQESLLEHLLYMDELLQSNSQPLQKKSAAFPIQKKLIHLEKLHAASFRYKKRRCLKRHVNS